VIEQLFDGCLVQLKFRRRFLLIRLPGRLGGRDLLGRLERRCGSVKACQKLPLLLTCTCKVRRRVDR
jgi:hypothetical protein